MKKTLLRSSVVIKKISAFCGATSLAILVLLILSNFSAKAAKFNFASTDVFATVYATMADGDTLWLTTPGSTAYYTNLTGATFTRSTTVMADPSLSSIPVLVQATFSASATTYNKIEFAGFESYYFLPNALAVSNYFFTATANPGLSITTVKFKNCTIHGYGRAMLRSDNNSLNVTITNLLVDNCIFYDFGRISASYSVFAMKGAITSNVSITNTTFYGSPDGVYLTANTGQVTFLMQNCTIIQQGNYNSGTAGTPVAASVLISFGAANASSTFTIQDCIISGSFTNINSVTMGDGTYLGTAMTTANVIKFNTATATNVNVINSVILGNTFSTPATPKGTYTPITANSLTYNFGTLTIVTDPTSITGIGDPRWLVNPAAPSAPIAPIANNGNMISQSSFEANWNNVADHTGYYLDVATDNAFTNFVSGFNNRDIAFATSFIVPQLTTNTTYYYRIRSYNAAGTSTNSNTIMVTTLAVIPTVPVATAATDISSTGFTANWGSVATATGYYLDVASDNMFANLLTNYSNKDVSNVTTFSVTGLTGGTSYYYRVRAYNTGGTSTSSDTITVTTSAAVVAPDAPVASAATTIDKTSFSANWAASTTATGYYLDVATDNAFTAFVTGFNNKDVSNVTTFSVTGLTSATTYYYRVRAYNTGGTSANSSTITAITSAAIVAPDAPVASAATSIAKTSFSANWAASTGATGYYLDVATDNAFTAFVNGFNNKDVSNVTTFSVTGLTAATTYYYRVKAYNTGGTSASSSTITVLSLGTAVPSITAQELNIKVSDNAVTIESANSAIISVQAMNINGKTVALKNISATTTVISTDGWSSGIYIFTINTQSGVVTEKIGIVK